MSTPPKLEGNGSFWAWVPVLLLGSMFLGLGTLAYIAINDPHFALEPNYYDKAVHWDRVRAQERESAATGLRATFTHALKASAGGRVELELKVIDRDERPVLGASVEVEAFPNAYASHIEHVTLKEKAPGVYVGELSGSALGLWELRLDVTRGSLHFHDVVRQDVFKADRA